MITRAEIIEVCNKLGLIEYRSPMMDDFRPWRIQNKIFKCANDATVVVISKNPKHKYNGNRLYF